jgi:hypothetical protein
MQQQPLVYIMHMKQQMHGCLGLPSLSAIMYFIIMQYGDAVLQIQIPPLMNLIGVMVRIGFYKLVMVRMKIIVLMLLRYLLEAMVNF